MNVSKISFNGYKEYKMVSKFADKSVLKALDNARPYLEQIGNCMPYQRDLEIMITNDNCDTFLKAYDNDKKNAKSKLLAEGNEHTLTEYGLDFVEKVFRGLEKNNSEEFKDIAAGFVKRLSNIMWKQHPINMECSSPCSKCGH